MDFKDLSNPLPVSDSIGKPSVMQNLRSPFSKFSPGSKKPIAIALTIFIIFALILGVYLLRKPTQLAPQASGSGVGISLRPGAITVGNVNEEFNVDVFVDTGTSGLQISAVQAKVNYNPAVLELKNVALKDYLPVTLKQPLNTSGSTSFAVGSTVGQPKTGSGTVATITFKTLVSSATDPNLQPTQITFETTGTGIAAVNQTASVANDFTPAVITFGPHGSPTSSPITSAPEASFTLEKPIAETIPVGQEFEVKVLSRSDIDNANLWNATITFPKNLVEVVRINKTGSFITSWTEEFFSNTTGEISLTGGVTSPGFKTNLNQGLMATIVFRTKAAGQADINIVAPSNIFRNSDNTQIMQIKRNVRVQIGTGSTNPSPSPSAMSSASPSPSPSAGTPQKGDGNNDGKVDLQDLSIMFTKWSPAIDIVSHFKLDFDDNKRINSFDYSEMRQLLKSLGIIRG